MVIFHMAQKKESKNKIIEKISKTTLGTSLDHVSDFVDLISQFISEYFDQKYKIQKKAEDVKRATLKSLYALKKEFIKSIVEGAVLATAVLSLILGVLIVLAKVMPLEYVFILYGLVVTMFILFRMKTE